MDYLWNAVKDMEFQKQYIIAYRARVGMWIRFSNITLAFLSSSAFAGLAFFDAVPWLFALISALCVFWQIANQFGRPYQIAPYLKRFEREVTTLSEKTKRLWVDHCDDKGEEFLKLANEVNEEFARIENDCLENDLQIPSIKRVSKKAEKATLAFLYSEYGVEQK